MFGNRVFRTIRPYHFRQVTHDPLVPSLSVVIPVRNGESTLAVQLHALFCQQAAPPFEVIVADNGSTDRTVELAEELSSSAPLGVELTVVDCSQRVGVSAARNAGVQASRADLVLICDADDVVSPIWVRDMMAALETYDLVGGALDETRLNSELDAVNGRGLDKELPVSLRFLPFALGANVGVRRNVIDAIGGWDETFVGGGDDIDFSWRAQLAGYTLGFCGTAVIDYRLRKDLKGAYKQAYRNARAGPRLYRVYGHLGARRRTARSIAYSWFWIISRAPMVVFGSYGLRLQWCRRVGLAFGRVAGSITNRVVYL
ncbi:MAG: glycosyltransferase [Acidimicrobiales bacterium]